MSRLEKFVNESIRIGDTTYHQKEVDKILKEWPKVAKECSLFIKELTTRNRDMNLMYRGSNRSNDTGKKKVRDDRVPKDMPTEAHEVLDDAFENLYGWKARSSGLFCTGREATAKGYGTAQIIFPIGRYRYLWSGRISDLYSHTNDGNSVMNTEPDEDMIEMWRDQYYDEYGENGYGSWLWQGNSIQQDKETTIDIVKQDMVDATKHDIEWIESQDEPDEDELENLKNTLEYNESQDYRDEIESELEWEPYETWDEYYVEQEENYGGSGEGSVDAAEGVIRGEYESKNLIKALQHSQGTEIMVKCKEYYFFNHYYKDIIEKLLFDSEFDPQQTSFDFS